MSTEYIPEYRYTLPSSATLRESLERVLGTEAGVRTYEEACGRLGLSCEDDLSADQLRTLARDLIDNGHGLVRVVGRTLVIRLETYRQLESEPTPAGPVGEQT